MRRDHSLNYCEEVLITRKQLEQQQQIPSSKDRIVFREGRRYRSAPVRLAVGGYEEYVLTLCLATSSSRRRLSPSSPSFTRRLISSSISCSRRTSCIPRFHEQTPSANKRHLNFLSTTGTEFQRAVAGHKIYQIYLIPGSCFVYPYHTGTLFLGKAHVPCRLAFDPKVVRKN